MWGRSHARMLETLLSINWKMKVRFNRDFGENSPNCVSVRCQGFRSVENKPEEFGRGEHSVNGRHS